MLGCLTGQIRGFRYETSCVSVKERWCWRYWPTIVTAVASSAKKAKW